MPSRSRLGALLVTFALGAVACQPARRAHTEEDEAAAPSVSAEPTAEAAAPHPDLPPGSVAREEVDDFLLRGPSQVFQRVRISDVHKKNKFVGWRIDQFPSEWDSVGLKVGDIVTSANGMSLESQDDFFDAWVKLADANEIRIAYDRGGQPGEAVLKVVGDATPETKAKLQDGAPPETARTMSPSPGKRGTIIITEDGRKPADN